MGAVSHIFAFSSETVVRTGIDGRVSGGSEGDTTLTWIKLLTAGEAAFIGACAISRQIKEGLLDVPGSGVRRRGSQTVDLFNPRRFTLLTRLNDLFIGGTRR